MSKNPLSQLSQLGQSFWFDNIQRAMIKNGDIRRMIDEDDLRGITSNPSIFEKAITQSQDYDDALIKLIDDNLVHNSREAFFSLAIEDIQNAADILLPVYQKTNGLDGYVSLEVSPDLAHDTKASVEEAQKLFLRLNRPNAMIKIPSTKAGIPAIRQLISEGININATLLFSVERYMEVANAYIEGINDRVKRGMPVKNINSVASFFVSRVDTLIDKTLDESDVGDSLKKQLKGKMGIANAKLAYDQFGNLFSSERFRAAEEAGANAQRLLWASTGTKNPDYSDVLYIDNLIGEKTVNTIPPATAEAFKHHGKTAPTLSMNIEEAQREFAQLNESGINVSALMDQLEEEGVATFDKSFKNLLEAIDSKLKGLGKNYSKTHVA